MPENNIQPEKEVSPDNNKNPSRFRQFFSSYLFMPPKMKVETQEPDETIILLLRKHWVTNIGWVSVSLILIISPLFLFPLFFTSGIFTVIFPLKLLYLVTLSWYLLSFSFMLVNFLIWYFTVSVVTNKRIIDIDFENILQKKFAATLISRVEDVSLHTGGFVRSLFDYGDVMVQTAAAEGTFSFMAVPHPELVVRTINKLMGKE